MTSDRPNVFQVNLSPALGNDCSVDSQVKKPLLHDMFDLLGLPVCNTGLSRFQTTGGPTAGPRFGSGGRPSALAAAATEKWRTSGRRSACNGAATQPQQSAVRPAVKPPWANDDSAACNASPVWGNGRDWRNPVDSDGGWVRVFPFAAAAESPQTTRAAVRPPSQQRFGRPVTADGNRAARAMINDVREYLRCCVKVARSCDGLSAVSDDELNDKLKDLFPAVTKVWLPPN